MSERHHFDVVVLGRGLIGSAIGKYLKLESRSLSVAVIGPDERQKQPTTDSHTSHTTKVYGAHYDEGRMTRLVDANPTWSYLAQESYKKYKDIESISGITFFEQRGFLGVGEAFGEETSNVCCQNPTLSAHHLTEKIRDLTGTKVY
jgi:glycine/D-amino acid oxidase-like deaminating enzyme